MRCFPPLRRLLSAALPAVLFLAFPSAHAQQVEAIPAHRASKTDRLESMVPAFSSASVEGLVPVPLKDTPLSGLPYVFALDRRAPDRMTAEDSALLSSLQSQLFAKAALAGFDLSTADWTYRQVVCPAAPDYLFLDYHHGPDPNGSSQFVALLERQGSDISIVSKYAHGLRPFDAAWSKGGTYRIYNRLLRRERGTEPMSTAPNWLVLGMCFAELTGNHVQVLAPQPNAANYQDFMRLNALQPQLNVAQDKSAQIVFSDLSKPGTTTQWSLTFDRNGQLDGVSVSHERQPKGIALKPNSP